MRILGVDVGGTFTDAVLLEDGTLRVAKVPTAARQEESVLASARAVGADRVEHFRHGTTMATNARLERKGARTAFVGSASFDRAGSAADETSQAAVVSRHIGSQPVIVQVGDEQILGSYPVAPGLPTLAR